jgi:hypothetical protein
MAGLNSIVRPTGHLEAANSSTSILTAGSTFTGEWVDVGNHTGVTVAVKTDQNGTYTVQFSPDGVNIDSTLTRYYRIDQIEVPHRFTITRQYLRVTFTNTSASDQTYFRLQTKMGEFHPLNAPADSSLSQDYDSTVVRPTDFKYEVALGLRQGYTTWNKWGYNATVSAGTETLWSVSTLFSRMTTADTLVLTSSSTNDIVTTGTGAQSVVIYGVNENYDPIIEVVPMNGTGGATTTNQFFGINRLAVYLAGANGVNAGTITATTTTPTTTQSEIPVGEGSSQHAFFFVPQGHTALLDWMTLSCAKLSGGAKPNVTYKMWVTSLVSGAKYEVFRSPLDVTLENHLEFTPSQPFVVGEKSLIEIQITSDTANTVASGRFSLILARAAATQTIV